VATDICVRLGERVRALRRQRGWTQIYLAVHTGLGRIYISDIERGAKEPCLRTLETLADGFEMPLSELFENL
jgi:transcriptional regulator with XRE-family HTH domain